MSLDLINRTYNLVNRINVLLQSDDRVPVHNRSLGTPSSKIFIGNLHPETYARQLENIFKDYNPVHVRAQLRDKPCIAFVDFKDIETATRVINNFNGKTIFGRPMRLMYCRPENGEATGHKLGYNTRPRNYSPERDAEQSSRKRVRRYDD